MSQILQKMEEAMHCCPRIKCRCDRNASEVGFVIAAEPIAIVKGPNPAEALIKLIKELQE